jgi:hypothetical protein
VSDAKDLPEIRAGNINICFGIQIINVGGDPSKPSAQRRKRSRLEMLNNGIISTPPNDNNWHVVGAGPQGVGRLCRLSVTYLDPVPTGRKVRGRVYQGTAGSLDDPGYDAAMTVDGCRENGGLKWTWSAAPFNLEGVAYSPTGLPNYCAFWIVNESDNSFVNFDAPLRAFSGIPAPNGSGSCGSGSGSTGIGSGTVMVFAAAKRLNLLILDGKLLGEHMLQQVGPLIWRISSGPLKGCIDFFGHGDSLMVLTPFGELVVPLPREWPYSLVLPGDLFGSSHDVVVTGQ